MSNTQLTVEEKRKKADEEFQEKLKERMRQAMGDLMPDEVLAGIVAKGIDEAFFQPQKTIVYTGYNRTETNERPSWLIEFMQSEAKKMVSEKVTEWCRANEGKFKETLEQVLQKGLMKAVIEAFECMTICHTRDMVKKVVAQITGKDEFGNTVSRGF